ncbi:hypothetical protein NA57DRAFT_78111 [Rhizodiscina lignyota]|uniref:Uncharacterized protein n=1 Tax=Rhizodiscina lignyota TaxID=1504668 RepID=A0A9P4M458_9PEZI|nr:hypothetical protein NA57DRAFT_78111 [Rhizodiscina lignyota]
MAETDTPMSSVDQWQSDGNHKETSEAVDQLVPSVRQPTPKACDVNLDTVDAELEQEAIEELKAASMWNEQMAQSDVTWSYSNGSELVPITPWPWIRSRGYKDPDSAHQTLCMRCSLLNLDFLFSKELSSIHVHNQDVNELKTWDRRGINLGPLAKIRESSSCLFCSLIWDASLKRALDNSMPLFYNIGSAENDLVNLDCFLENSVQRSESDKPSYLELTSISSNSSRPRMYLAILGQIDTNSMPSLQ